MRIAPLRPSCGLSIAAAVLLLCAASPVLAVCGGDCGTDLAATPKAVEKYVKHRWKAIAKCGKQGVPACPITCPVPDATAAPYLLSPTCAAQIDCNLDALAATAYGVTWDGGGFCPLAPADTCGNARAKNAGKLVSTRLKRRVTSKMDKLPKDEAKCIAKITKVVACDASICTDAGDWIDGIFPVGLGKGGFQSVPLSLASGGEGVATLTLSASAADWGTLEIGRAHV
jgi:hypothetical protein